MSDTPPIPDDIDIISKGVANGLDESDTLDSIQRSLDGIEDCLRKMTALLCAICAQHFHVDIDK